MNLNIIQVFILFFGGSISPTFYVQLLHLQIPKAQKNSVKPSVFFALLGSARIKAVSKMLLVVVFPAF
jgi:hypothetical protein